MSPGQPAQAFGRLVPGTAVVTGGGSGIGRAMAEALAAGRAVALVDILPEGGRDAASHIEAQGGQALFIEGDVSRSAESTAPSRKRCGSWAAGDPGERGRHPRRLYPGGPDGSRHLGAGRPDPPHRHLWGSKRALAELRPRDGAGSSTSRLLRGSWARGAGRPTRLPSTALSD